MKKISLAVLTLALITACKTTQTASTTTSSINTETTVNIDLVNVTNDQVLVEMIPAKFSTETATFNIPKTVPGTYSVDNYGKFIEDLKAFDNNGVALNVSHTDDNSWVISKANTLAKITYLVNDTYDIEDSHTVFSPAGTNILKDENFMLNLHGFVGYFKSQQESPYIINISHPENLDGSTAMLDSNIEAGQDTFTAKRYFEVIDNPIMYNKGNNTSFNIGGVEISISVYSPSNSLKATDLKEEMQKMMEAQKTFLGDINSTSKYSILLYMSKGQGDAGGFGALEHHTSTTVVFPEMMPAQMLSQSMIDVVSHEFFHTVTPLTVHSNEVQYFDYNDPKMSKHLWMYEGVTEYFANLFQVNQELIDEYDFYKRILGKVNGSKRYDDSMSFTKMSANILEEPYKAAYTNVYEKGALIGMCIDLIIRENSNGEKGILDMMKALSNKYGVDKAFNDDDLFKDIAGFTYPAVSEFIAKHVEGTTPIDYTAFFNKVGLSMQSAETKTGYLMKDMQTPYISVDPKTKEVFFLTDTNTFLTKLGVKPDDRLVSIDGTAYDLKNVQQLVMGSFNWEEGNDMTMVVKRAGKEISLKGIVTKPMGTSYTLAPDNLPY